MKPQKGFTKRVVTYYDGNEVGVVMLPAEDDYVHLTSGWSLPITHVNKPTHSYEVHIQPRHKNLRPTWM
ncbi:TPA: hypothetical protein L6676_000329 [Escherichia coli]|nr:hypothetical protein [Escherichia coli]